MRRRFLVVLGVLALLFVLPGFPPVRDALVRFGLGFAERAGYTVRYERSGGNLLYNLQLYGVAVTGPGVDATVDTARVGYTLPALLTGRLPLRTAVTGVRGTVEADAFTGAARSTPEPPPAPAARRGFRVRPVLQGAELSDLALDVSGLPFNVPDARALRLEVAQSGETLTFDAALAVQDAVAEASGTVALNPWQVDATVRRADVALAEPFFEGARGGTLSGTVRADAGGVTADLELDGGTVDLVGLELSEVAGPVTVRGERLTTELTGRALGGPLSGTASVDFGRRQWQADVTGDAALGDALVWASQGRLSENVVDSALQPSGTAAVRLSVGGWQTFTLTGQATGAGRLLGEPLEDLNVDFGFETDVGVDVAADATLGGQPLEFALTPEGEGFTITATGTDLPLRGFEGDVDVDLASQGGRLTGTSDVLLTGRALGRSARLRADAVTDGDGWQVALSGGDARGGRLSGDLTLEGDTLTADVRARALALPGLAEPVNLTVRAGGPLQNLPLSVRAGGPDGVRPLFGGVRAEADFSGEATATFADGALGDLRGEFGPLSVSGGLDDLRYALESTQLGGRAAGRVALRGGRLTRQDGQLETTAVLETTDLRSSGVTLPDLQADLSLSQGETLSAQLTDRAAGLDVAVRDGTLTGDLRGTRIGALGETFATTGRVSGRTARLTDTLELAVQAETPGDGPGTTLRAVGDAQNTQLSVRSDDGATLAGRTLAGGLELSGEGSLAGRSADLAGTLGGVDVRVDAAPDATGRLRTQAGLGANGQNFTADFGSLASFSTDGTLPLAELGRALGLPLSGRVQTTLSRRNGLFTGRASVQGEAFGFPLTAQATPRGDALGLTATSALLGQTLTVSGTALPETDLTATLGEVGSVRARGQYPALQLTGSGTVPGVVRAGLEVAPQPWTLQGSLEQGQAALRVGSSRLTARRGANGWALSARLEQPATFRGLPVNLAADLERTPARPDGLLNGTLTFGDAPVTLSGTLRDLQIAGNVPAEALQPGLLGTLALDGSVDPFTQTYDVRPVWRRPDGSAALRVRAAGTRGELSATVRGEGLGARVATDDGLVWSLRADGYGLERLPVAALQGLGGRLDGFLGGSRDGYRGDLQLTAAGADLRLRGRGERVDVGLEYRRGDVSATASGPLLPTTDVTLAARAGDAATLAGGVTGTLSAPELRATLASAAGSFGGGQVTLPARQLLLQASLQNGLRASLTGDGADVRLQDAAWSGGLELPFTLRGGPHRLAGTLRGGLAEPTFDGALTGETVQGPLTLARSGLEGDLTVTPGLDALPDASVRLGLSATPEGRWRVALGGEATLPYRDLPATLAGELRGRGGRYDGAATLAVAGEEVPVTVTGEGGRVQARAEVAALELRPFVPATGTVTGDVRVSTGGGLRYFADLQGRGEAAGRAFDLSLTADRSGGVSVTGTAAGASVSVRAPLPLDTVNVRLADGQTPLDLDLDLALGETLTVRGGGGLRGEPLAVLGVYTPRFGRGDLSLGFGDARLNAALRTRPGGRAVDLSLLAPAGVLNVTTPLSASLRATQSGDALTLSAAEARVGAASLTLSGSVRPRAALTGTLTVPAAGEPLGVRMTSLETGYLAALTQGGLELRSVLSRSFRPERARLVGRAARPRLGVALQSDLVWQEGAGFSGRADATFRGARRGAVRAVGGTLTLLGRGGLQVRGDARYAGESVAKVAARLSPVPWQDRALRGTLQLDAPVDRLSPAWFGDPLALRGTLELSGDLTTPQLAGPLQLRGALGAAGTLRASREGANLALSGRGLSGSAALGAAGYRATLALSDLGVGTLLPGDRAAALSGALRASGTWGGGGAAQLSDLRLTSGGSRITGRARLGGVSGGVSAALGLEVYARDLSPALRGRLSGPVFVSEGAPLAGTLRLQNLGPAGADWRLGGEAALRGRLENPAFDLALRGRGSASGDLSALFEPRRGHLNVTSTLALLGAETDLTLTRTRLGVSAAGGARYRDFGATLSTQGRRVLLAGRDKLAGWTGFYGPERLALTGPLGSLNPQLQGRFDLRGAADLSAVRGTLADAQAGPLRLGDAAFTRRGGALELSGDALTARVGLTANLPYTLSRLDLALPGGARLALSGSGTRGAGRVEGSVTAAGSRVPLSARYAPEGADLRADGRTPLGALELRARLRGGRLGGELNVREGGRRTVESTLSGTPAAPTVSGRFDVARGENGLRGSFRAGRQGLRLDALASSPLLDAPLIVTGTGYPASLRLAAPAGAVTFKVRDGRLEPAGRLPLNVGPVRVLLQGADGGRALRVRLGAPAAPGLVLGADLPTAFGDLAALAGGVTLTGFGRTSGRLAVRARPAVSVAADALRWRSPAGPVTLSGTGRLAGGVQAALAGRFVGAQRLATPWLRGVAVPFELRADGGRYTLRSAGDLGQLDARLSETGTATLTGDLTLGRGRLEADLGYARDAGPSGRVALTTVPLFRVGDDPATLTSRLTLDGAGVAGDGALELAGGQIDVTGTAGWARLLPASLRSFTPAGGDALAAQVRLDRFELGDLPPLASRVPYLSAPVSGVATLSGTQIVGQLVARELEVLETSLPTEVDFNGSFADLAARATVGDSRLNVRFGRTEAGPLLAGLLTLEGFPLQVLPEAVAGASGLAAPVTGAARFELPLQDLQAGYVRVATERLTLRSADGADEATEGDVALRFEDGRLYVERAVFRGGGFWQAQGVLTPENLDFTFEADEADFTPLLRLVPQLAAFGVGAQGSLSARATGSAAAPEVTLSSPRLELSVAGTRYRALDTQASLRGDLFDLEGELVGVAPVTGRFDLSGDGRVQLNPFRTDSLALRFRGDAVLPTVGEIANIRGRVYPTTSGWRLDSRGVLGRPVRVSGPLTPLELDITGRNLDIRAPRQFLAGSSTDLDLALRAQNGMFRLSGDVFVRRAQLSLNRRGAGQTGAAQTDAADAGAAPAGETAAGDSGTGADPAADPVDAAVASIGSAVSRTENPVLARFRFDDVTLRAPQEVLFDEAFGTAEIGADLTLSGTAAEPRLAGQAETLSGSIRFSGQDFTLERAVAEFDPARGALPTLSLTATASFDKASALGSAQGVTIVEPPEPSFDVQLAISGGFDEGLGGRPALDLSPTLTSTAQIQEAGAPSPRPLSETELVSLLTLGRLQLDTAVGGDNSLAGTALESALDTAVDLLVVSELQNALSDVLGVELFEIRTSAFSSILGADGSDETFGVSVRFGGYLNDNLFASVQIGRYSDPEQAYALSNEFLLRYTAAPLELNLTGGVNFLDRTTLDGTTTLAAITDFSLGLSYAVTPLISLDASLETQALGEDTSLGFGVSFTW